MISPRDLAAMLFLAFGVTVALAASSCGGDDSDPKAVVDLLPLTDALAERKPENMVLAYSGRADPDGGRNFGHGG
jgi:hypothetical protein